MAFFLHRALPGTGLFGYHAGHFYFPFREAKHQRRQ
ncbi:MAG: hypothetical protein QOE70_2864 [Chthoniobacter sp.]|jgi:hypothetical protein|nr:hypothetical protein [Chthoniobacter sp.]